MTPWDDSWDGFEAERQRILETLANLKRDGETTVVTLTGDMHTTLATSIRKQGTDSDAIGVEFMTPGVTSVNFSEAVDVWAAEDAVVSPVASHRQRWGRYYGR